MHAHKTNKCKKEVLFTFFREKLEDPDFFCNGLILQDVAEDVEYFTLLERIDIGEVDKCMLVLTCFMFSASTMSKIFFFCDITYNHAFVLSSTEV